MFAKIINHFNSANRKQQDTEAKMLLEALTAASAALPHGLWHATCSAASCLLTGEGRKAAVPGTAKFSVLEFSSE